jgi:hypothetical protein
MRPLHASSLIASFVAAACSHTSPTTSTQEQLATPAPALAFFGAVSSAEEMAQITAQLCAVSATDEGRWHCAECPEEQSSIGDAPTHEVTALRQGRWALIHVSGCQHADTSVNEDSGVFVMRQEGADWARHGYKEELSLSSCERRSDQAQEALWCERRMIFGDTITRSMHIFTADEEGYALRESPPLRCDALRGCTTHAEGECAEAGRWTAPDLDADGVADWRWEGVVSRWSGDEALIETSGGECVRMEEAGLVQRRAREVREWRTRDGRDELTPR